MFIVIGSEAKESLGWFLQFRWGPGVEVEVFMRRIKLLFGSTLVHLSSTTGSPTSSLAKRRLKVIKGVKHDKVVGGRLLCKNLFITGNSLDKRLLIY